MKSNRTDQADWLKTMPIAHRGLHDGNHEIFENSLSGAKAAIEHGFAIEVDLHPSRDGVAMVFHDETLDRLTSETGAFRLLNADELEKIHLGDTDDTIPRLSDLLELVDGRVGLVLELKGIEGKDEGFVAAMLSDLSTYKGPVAIMSFDHWLLADARDLGATIPVGLTAEGDDGSYETHRNAFEKYQPDFLSYSVKQLPNRFVEEFRASGRPVITWTVRNNEQVERTYRHADQMTFEGFLPMPDPSADNMSGQ